MRACPQQEYWNIATVLKTVQLLLTVMKSGIRNTAANRSFVLIWLLLSALTVGLGLNHRWPATQGKHACRPIALFACASPNPAN